MSPRKQPYQQQQWARQRGESMDKVSPRSASATATASALEIEDAGASAREHRTSMRQWLQQRVRTFSWKKVGLFILVFPWSLLLVAVYLVRFMVFKGEDWHHGIGYGAFGCAVMALLVWLLGGAADEASHAARLRAFTLSWARGRKDGFRSVPSVDGERLTEPGTYRGGREGHNPISRPGSPPTPGVPPPPPPNAV